MKRFGIAAGAAAALLVCLGAYGVTKFTTDQANVAAPGAVNLSGVAASGGSSRSFARADHVHSISGTLPEANGGTNAGALTCNADQWSSTNGTSYSCKTLAVGINSTLTGAGSTASPLGIALSNANTWTGAQTFAPSSGITTATSSGATRGQQLFTPMAADPTTPSGDGEFWVSGAAGAARHASVRLNSVNALFAGNPMLAATTAAGQSIANATTAIVVYGTVERDTDSGYNNSTGRYTIPTGKGGDYNVTACVMYSNAQTGVVHTSIYKNAAVLRDVQAVNPGGTQSVCIAALQNVAAGDILDIRTSHPAGTAQALVANAQFHWFSVKRSSD